MVHPDAELEGILRRSFPGSRIEACTELNGGVSARAVAVTVEVDASEAKRVVVRRPRGETPAEGRDAARREYQLLQRCAELGVLAPKPYSFDAEAGAVLLEYVPGAPLFVASDLDRILSAMARELVRIHAVRRLDSLSFLERYAERAKRNVLQTPQALDLALGEATLRAVLRRIWPWPQHNADTLLHGDYWPGNLLWADQRLVAVLDWEEAAIGDPLADLSIARLDVLWAFGAAAMDRFTQHYREQTQLDWNDLPRWDLCAALRPMSNLARWAPSYALPPISRPDVTELSMQAGHRSFVTQAMAALGVELDSLDDGRR